MCVNERELPSPTHKTPTLLSKWANCVEASFAKAFFKAGTCTDKLTHLIIYSKMACLFAPRSILMSPPPHFQQGRIILTSEIGFCPTEARGPRVPELFFSVSTIPTELFCLQTSGCTHCIVASPLKKWASALHACLCLTKGLNCFFSSSFTLLGTVLYCVGGVVAF